MIATKAGTLDGTPHPGLARPKGHIGFLGHGDRVDFRRIRIKSLAELAHTSDSLDTVKQRLAKKEAVLLDVRESSEWNEAHVEGAISLPSSKLQKSLDAEALSKNVHLVLMLSSMLHSIGVGNMLPSWVRVVCVDINPAVVTKLSDRGSTQTVGVVTDVGLFLHRLAEALGD